MACFCNNGPGNIRTAAGECFHPSVSTNSIKSRNDSFFTFRKLLRQNLVGLVCIQISFFIKKDYGCRIDKQFAGVPPALVCGVRSHFCIQLSIRHSPTSNHGAAVLGDHSSVRSGRDARRPGAHQPLRPSAQSSGGDSRRLRVEGEPDSEFERRCRRDAVAR